MRHLIPQTRSIAVLTAAAAVTAVLALGACSGQESASPTPSPAAPSTTSTAASSVSPSSAGASSAAPSTAASGSATASSTTSAVLAAGATAEDKTSAIVASIESESNGTAWEVHLIGNDGSEQKLVLSADGETVTSGPTVESVDADDRAENQRYAAVNVDYRRAVAGIDKEVPGGAIVELHLDTAGSTIVWEADVTTGTESRTVQLDASTGTVISNKVDD